ncbi:MAG: Glycosyltransferase involved in cell wall bisynthesis [Candidatus Alkanophagales archaeon MCA70_species_1]|nr:Glycosyltransferase involved in cell wall bisynthesis [Candidatus Alkanophaga volatiphilum]
MNDGSLKTREVMRGVEVHRPFIDASEILPLFVTEDLRKWGGQIKFFNDVLIYNFLSATKFVNDLIKKEGYKFDIISAHDWLSAIAGIASKNRFTFCFSRTLHGMGQGA